MNMIMHRPIPGPEYWSGKCLRCDGTVSTHAPWWRRAITALKDQS